MLPDEDHQPVPEDLRATPASDSAQYIHPHRVTSVSHHVLSAPQLPRKQSQFILSSQLLNLENNLVHTF